MYKNYIIELKGIGIVNKGAYLMLLSLLDKFKDLNPNIEFCARPNEDLTYYDLCKLNIKPKISFRDKRLPWDLIFKIISKANRRKYGLIHNDEIDLIVDASGFAYGDFWGTKYTKKRMSNVVNSKVKNETKLILMPQAYGPFKNNKLKKSFEKIIDKAELIFVRDNKSYDFLINSFNENDKFILSPDFTNLLESGAIKNYREGNICIIPNNKMLYNERYKDNYFSFMSLLINHLIDKEESPYFLIHEGDNDFELANDINKKIKGKLPIVYPDDPIVIKNRIKSSNLVIVSRYHGLVSALSQGVPIIATSWSHKYKEVLKDYNKSENLVDIFNYNKDDLLSKVDSLISLNLKAYKNEQSEFVDKEKEKVKRMWKLIGGAISNGKN